MPANPDSEVKPYRPYTNLQIRLHWVVALLVGVQWWAGEGMHEIAQVLESQGNLGFGQFLVSTLHSFGGLLIFVLVVWRVRLRWQRRAPERKDIPTGFQRLARLNHYCLYLLIGLMVVSGSLSYYQLLPMAGFHGYCGVALKILVFLHVIAALYHRFVRNDAVLGGMWFEKLRP